MPSREDLFHAWRTFDFDENSEAIDSYVTHIRQEAALLGYGEPQILDVIKNTFPSWLYWALSPIEDPKQGAESKYRNHH